MTSKNMYLKKSQKLLLVCFLSFFCILFLGAKIVYSDEYTTTNFKVLDPVMDAGGFGSSASFNLFGVISQISNGSSVSTSFGDNAGFLYFPYVSTPVVSTTAGDSQLTLSWTTSTGYLGWTTSGYNIGQSAISGGPYSYVSLGDVTSSVRTGLTNGVIYYFVVAVKDALGNVIATSSEVSVTPVAAVVVPPSGGGGGGGGGGTITPPPATSQTGVVFSGRAYPLSKVAILKDAQLAVTTIAGPDSNFKVTLSGLSAGNYNFAVYGEDKNGIRSSLFTFPIMITSGVMVEVSGIFIAPTIAVDKSEVKRGDNIAIFGQSTPASEVTIRVNSAEEHFIKKTSDAGGVYLLNFDTSVLEMGKHDTKSKSAFGGEISAFSKVVGFIVGTKNVAAVASASCPNKADLNSDCSVNLVDFSIAAYWYKRPLSAAFKVIEKAKLNGDGKLDLIDFSIMAYYWTG